ncbi:MAG: metallophosphoesterase [Anaerolineae bacterium]|nr:metallophosphoesterase [Anaerolineae bacterium]
MNTFVNSLTLPLPQPVVRPGHQRADTYALDVPLESERLVLRRIGIDIDNLPPTFDGYRIAHLSDLHFGPALTYRTVMSALLITRDLQPNLIVITGDLVSSYVDEFLMPDALSRLSAPDGVWAVLGNHDHDTDAEGVTRVLRRAGVHVLRNSNARIARGDAAIWLAGVDDILTGQHDLDATLAGIPEGKVSVLLAHEPDYADEVAATGRVSLQLSGHCHGGPPRIPVLDVLVMPWIVQHGRKYPYGLYRTGDMWLYTSAGAGRGSLPRFHGMPEVAEITLLRNRRPGRN